MVNIRILNPTRFLIECQPIKKDFKPLSIRTVDSYHKIFTAFVGKPFPATTSSRFAADTNEIDIKKKVTEVISKDIKRQRLEEKKEIEEIKALVNKWDAAELDSSTLVDEAQRGQEAWKACQAVTGRIE